MNIPKYIETHDPTQPGKTFFINAPGDRVRPEFHPCRRFWDSETNRWLNPECSNPDECNPLHCVVAYMFAPGMNPPRANRLYRIINFFKRKFAK